MQIPDEIRKCVVFLGFTKADGTHHLRGTGFFVSRPADTIEDLIFCYLVTARHVIQKIMNLGLDSVSIRATLKNGESIWVDVPASAWVFHETDPTVDVAVVPFKWSYSLDHLLYPLSASLAPSIIAHHRVGPGDDVFLAGLFSQHFGRERNIPVVRVGNISAMPGEKVMTKMGPIDAYLVEARSTGGISGSPVFLHLGGGRTGSGGFSITTPTYYLLGMVHGHFDEPDAVADVVEDDLSSEKINMGIGIVVPVDKILEVLAHPEIVEKEMAEKRLKRDKNLPSMDSEDIPVDDRESFTKDDFEEALRKVSRKIEPPKPS